MKVKVKLFAILRELAGKAEDTLELPEGSTVEDLAKALASTYGQEFARRIFREGKLNPILHFLVNGKHISTLNGQRTGLSEGDVVSILPPVGGG